MVLAPTQLQATIAQVRASRTPMAMACAIRLKSKAA